MSGLEVLGAIADGRIDHPGMVHTLGFRIYGGDGSVLAKGSATCLIFRPRNSGGP